MKIITPGQLPGDKVHKATCANCSCVFEFKQSEGSLSPGGDFVTVACPQSGCSHHTTVTIRNRSYGYMDR